jgi:XTP/dITP diphosphohydrolase
MRIVLATTNPGKAREILAVFAACAQRDGRPQDVELVTLDALALSIDEPAEDQPSFEGNALLKAEHYAAGARLPCLADDSGLAVDALGGAPGVLSARYAGVEGGRAARDAANNAKLLRELAGVPMDKRGARFVCAMALAGYASAAPSLVVRGTVEGRILLPSEAEDVTHPERGRGGHGFGYDPLFFVPALGQTTAQLDPEHKNRISHRGDAARKMWGALRAS